MEFITVDNYCHEGEHNFGPILIRRDKINRTSRKHHYGPDIVSVHMEGAEDQPYVKHSELERALKEKETPRPTPLPVSGRGE